jgi:hypothetical protein
MRLTWDFSTNRQSPTSGSNRGAQFGRLVCYHYISGASHEQVCTDTEPPALVSLEGIEPSLPVPKTGVMPVHYREIVTS